MFHDIITPKQASRYQMDFIICSMAKKVWVLNHIRIKMIFAIEYKVVFLDYENITRNKKYIG